MAEEKEKEQLKRIEERKRELAQEEVRMRICTAALSPSASQEDRRTSSLLHKSRNKGKIKGAKKVSALSSGTTADCWSL